MKRRVWKRTEIASVLVGKLQAEHRDGANHDVFVIYDDAGRQRAMTKMSRGRGDQPKAMFSAVARNLGITNAVFDAVLDCSCSRDEYLKNLSNGPGRVRP